MCLGPQLHGFIRLISRHGAIPFEPRYGQGNSPRLARAFALWNQRAAGLAQEYGKWQADCGLQQPTRDCSAAIRDQAPSPGLASLVLRVLEPPGSMRNDLHHQSLPILAAASLALPFTRNKIGLHVV